MNIELNEFNNIFGMIDSAYHEAALKIGMSDSELSIYYVMAIHGDGSNQSLLYKETGQKKSTINSCIRKLEKEDMVYLKAGEGRNTRVFLTEAGKARMAKVKKIVDIEKSIYASWNDEERALFMELNKRYAEQFEEAIKEL
ncbi:MAG: MarR family transcriptional regulator [Eubacteriales bacterium]|nr:MarR family transcriptional regulator [Eubacteriales bacterium]